MENSKRAKQYADGLKAGIPVILGFVPVGIAYAIMARQAGFSLWQTCFMSLSVFAGASQMMAVGMYTQGAGILAMILATFILNLRHLIMSVCIMDRIRQDPTGLKLVASYGVTDEGFAIFTTQKQEKCSAMFLMGLLTVTYLSWNLGTLLGAVASDFLPPILTASLGIGLYAMFIGLLVPNLTHNLRLGILTVFTALCSTVFHRFLPSSWAMILATLLCAFLGVFFVDPEPGEEASHG